jgi:hypothetical protein
MVAPFGRPENFGDGRGRYCDPIGGPLGFQPFPCILPDQDIDQFAPLVLVDRFRQQFPVATVIVARFLLSHGSPATRFPRVNNVSKPVGMRNGFATVIPR